MTEEAAPAISDAYAYLRDTAVPAAQGAVTHFREEVIPAAKEGARQAKETYEAVKPHATEAFHFVKDNYEARSPGRAFFRPLAARLSVCACAGLGGHCGACGTCAVTVCLPAASDGRLCCAFSLVRRCRRSSRTRWRPLSSQRRIMRRAAVQRVCCPSNSRAVTSNRHCL